MPRGVTLSLKSHSRHPQAQTPLVAQAPPTLGAAGRGSVLPGAGPQGRSTATRRRRCRDHEAAQGLRRGHLSSFRCPCCCHWPPAGPAHQPPREAPLRIGRRWGPERGKPERSSRAVVSPHTLPQRGGTGGRGPDPDVGQTDQTLPGQTPPAFRMPEPPSGQGHLLTGDRERPGLVRKGQ